MAEYKFKVGDRVRVIKQTSSKNKVGDVGVVHQIYGDDSMPYKVFVEGGPTLSVWQSEDSIELVTYGYKEFDEILRPLTPEDMEHTLINDRLALYRAGTTGYSIKLDGFKIWVWKKGGQSQKILDFLYTELIEALKENEPVEVTLEQVAEKMGIPVSKLRIKE